jgi:hypothetical protein
MKRYSIGNSDANDWRMDFTWQEMLMIKKRLKLVCLCTTLAGLPKRGAQAFAPLLGLCTCKLDTCLREHVAHWLDISSLHGTRPGLSVFFFRMDMDAKAGTAGQVLDLLLLFCVISR